MEKTPAWLMCLNCRFSTAGEPRITTVRLFRLHDMCGHKLAVGHTVEDWPVKTSKVDGQMRSQTTIGRRRPSQVVRLMRGTSI